MIATTKFVFVCNRVSDRVETVYIGANASSFFFNTRINFRNSLDLGIPRLCRAVDFLNEIGDGLDAEINPFSKVGIGKITKLQVPAGIEATTFSERGNRVIVEAGPTIFPPLKMRHPVRNVHVDAIDSSGGDLPDSAHVNLAPFRRVGTNPDILVAFGDPECGARTEDSGLT